MNVKITGGWFYGALIVALSAWILHSFLLPLLVACVTAIASWPLYRQFVARLPRRMPPSATSLIFTLVMSVLVLAPLMFAVGALLAEARSLLLEIAAADKMGIAVPYWVENMPLVGPWVAAAGRANLRIREPSQCGRSGATRLLCLAGRSHSDSSRLATCSSSHSQS